MINVYLLRCSFKDILLCSLTSFGRRYKRVSTICKILSKRLDSNLRINRSFGKVISFPTLPLHDSEFLFKYCFFFFPFLILYSGFRFRFLSNFPFTEKYYYYNEFFIEKRMEKVKLSYN